MISLDVLRNKRPAVLALQNGRIFYGDGFGATANTNGEVVFTTFTATGYNQALTDPSNQGQIYSLTYPLIGNYGVPSWEKDASGIQKWFESNSIKCSGFVVHEKCNIPSHYESIKSIDEFLVEEKIPGIEGIDTRELTKILRTEGVQTGLLQVYESEEKILSEEEILKQVAQVEDPNLRHLVQEVSTEEPIIYNGRETIGTVVAVDCGIKNNILRELIKINLKIILVPYHTSYQDIMKYHPDGVFISNGPGDPKRCTETIEMAENLIENSIPTLGICLGNQILGLAAGGDTYKLKYGHRGGNKPVVDKRTGKAYITSQNHGFAVDTESLRQSHTGFLPLFENADDLTNEGVYHPTKPIFTVQFHPEGYPGPEDTTFLFDEFLRNMAVQAFTQRTLTGNSNGGKN
ncbi:MAG: carbamoyl-phosphate synthase (glutamine-hydrolyzing) small subunit [Promethearchaeota archaeon]|nr:MAG: carbamoyl-phosphate synthase (glutamine-hydrolyzing) small subunit [Candidatus Lokiarchaeota archaeon]